MNQNDNFYLAEAFQQLKCLDEEAFDLSADRGVVDELQSFVADDIEAPYEEEIIDVEADKEDELKKDYVGQVILRCTSCGAKIFKDIADVILDDNSEVANAEEECPLCGGQFGYEVIGKVEPFDEDEFKAEEEDEVGDDIGEGGEEVEPEFSEDEIHEALKEALNPDDQAKLDQIVADHLTDAAYEAAVDNELEVHRPDMEKAEKSFNDDFYFNDFEESCKNEECEDCKEEKCEEECDESLDEALSPKEFDKLLQKGNSEESDKLGDAFVKECDRLGIDQENASNYSELYKKLDKQGKEKITKVIKSFKESLTEEIDNKFDKLVSGEIYKADNSGEYKFIGTIEGEDGETLYKFEPIDELAIETSKEVAVDEPEAFDGQYCYMPGETVNYTFFDESLTEEVEVNINDKTAAEDAVKIEDSEQEPIKEELGDKAAEDAEKLVDPEENPVKESLTEDVENISVDVDGKNHIQVEPKEDGGVEIEVNPQHDEEAPVEDEMIAPLDDEDKDAIMGNDGEMPEEEPMDDFGAEDEFAVDEFEEESFDELGESFLKRVYENVDSFKTTKAIDDHGKLVVEGLIKFNSGKEKATSFVFEGFRNTKRGKVLVPGMNETFSKSNKAFLLKGTLADKKFVSESLTYNYTASQINESNESESVRVYGRAVRK